MVVVVIFDDGSRWLTDVGFGSQVPRRPLRIDQLDLDPQQDSKTYGAPLIEGDMGGGGSGALWSNIPRYP